MRYRDAAALRRALADRVRSAAGQNQQLSAYLRKRVAIHRLLARLLDAGSERWMVKGGIALAYRLGAMSRPTQDLDLACHADVGQVFADLRAAQQRHLGDFFRVIVTGSEWPLNLQGRALVHRFSVETTLAGTTFDTFKLDVALESARDAAEQITIHEPLLEGMGLDPLTVPVVSLPQHIAEKVHAYVRLHGPEGRQSSRPKDLLDLVLIQRTSRVRAAELLPALRLALAGEAFPTALPAPPTAWAVTYRRQSLSVGLDPDLRVAHHLAARFLDPLLAGAVVGDAVWDPQEQGWEVDTI